MKEKRKSYRERYFEDYEAVRVPADNRRGYRVDYRYIGQWCGWESPGRSLRTVKALMAGAEVLAVAVYAAAILSGTPVTRARLANGFGAVSLVPWLLELTGAARFVIAGEYVKELTCEEIGQSIRTGTVLRAALAALSMLAGGIEVIRNGTASAADIAVAAAVLVSAGASVLVRCLYGKLLVNTYRGQNGRTGSRI